MERGGIVGFHRSFLANGEQSYGYGFTENELADSYASISGYLKMIRAPRWLEDQILSTSSTELSWVDAMIQKDLKIDPIYEEFLLTKCGPPIPDQDQKEGVRLSMESTGRELSVKEKEIQQSIFGKVDFYNKCRLAASIEAISEAQL